ncbi:MAG: hypothetical protein L3J79_04670 [Candidatus Marinimicrobia bacterium]|nr:hypothetical protein [Candidatus Neomarinimicrobiota bacterium]
MRNRINPPDKMTITGKVLVSEGLGRFKNIAYAPKTPPIQNQAEPYIYCYRENQA